MKERMKMIFKNTWIPLMLGLVLIFLVTLCSSCEKKHIDLVNFSGTYEGSVGVQTKIFRMEQDPFGRHYLQPVSNKTVTNQNARFVLVEYKNRYEYKNIPFVFYKTEGTFGADQGNMRTIGELGGVIANGLTSIGKDLGKNYIYTNCQSDTVYDIYGNRTLFIISIHANMMKK